MKKRALLSVSDKTGIIDLARHLAAMGYEIVSTGGTYRAIADASVPVTAVSEVTGFPEILDGRVKTLHPAVHGGILGRRTQEDNRELEENSIQNFDLVVVNLYPFEQTLKQENASPEEIIENIDIGGPALIRAAAKNHREVAVVVNPGWYPHLLDLLEKEGRIPQQVRRELALEAFSHTAAYDGVIAGYFSRSVHQGGFPETLLVQSGPGKELRYGENPHQKAVFYPERTPNGLGKVRKLQGKDLSYNNYLDLDAALRLVREFKEPAAVIIKHTNPCGVAIGETLLEVYRKAYNADPVSAFGSVLAFNRKVEEQLAEEITGIFVEAVLAPGFTPAALEKFSRKKNLRVLELDEASMPVSREVKSVAGGFLVQEQDSELYRKEWRWATELQASAAETKDLVFAWKVVKHVKSNAIVTARNGVTTGIGPGQSSRVGAADIALRMAGAKASGSVLASDAFFPFRDTIDLAASLGVRAFIQPGGSLRDAESIKACEEQGLSMVLTGMRHFKH